MRGRLRRYPHVTAAGSPLHVRVGIATGLVVVGDLLGAGAAQEQAVVGETPNLAARSQAIAEPDMVLIAEATRKLLGNIFELQDIGAMDLKGIAAPARAWAALRVNAPPFPAYIGSSLPFPGGSVSRGEVLRDQQCRCFPDRVE
jgi:class 3 adenylate cyclase